MNSITRTIQKGELLLRAGDIATYGYTVISGCLKSYVLDDGGKEHILQFAPEEWIISDLDSLTNQIPSLIFIEACENSEVLMMPKFSYEEPNTLDIKI
jgi:CRP-like cAMP-binding protein